MKIPNQYLPIMPYLIFPRAAEFLVYAKNVFGATEQLIVPGPDGGIMHGEIKIGPAVVMISSGSDQWKEKTAAMYLYVEDVNKVYRAALFHNSKNLEIPQKKEYGYTAGFEDPFNNQWFIVESEK